MMRIRFGKCLRKCLSTFETLGAWYAFDMAIKRTISSTRTHHLTLSGTKSYVVVLPVEFVRHLKWKERQKLDITLEGDKLVIKDWKK